MGINWKLRIGRIVLMLSKEAQAYIELMREQEYHSDGSETDEQEEQLMSTLTQSVALFFNQTIHSINILKDS